MSVLSKPYFHDEAAAFAHVESVLWPEGATCPHCGNAGRVYELKNVVGKTGKLRHGLRKCSECRKQFTPMGGAGAIVEADETYFGKAENPQPSEQRKGRPYKSRNGRCPAGKRAVVSLVERGGSVRSFHVDKVSKYSVAQIVTANVARETVLNTDESRLYTLVGREFAAHETVKHSVGEYVRGGVHTNTIEGYFSVFKRGMKGVYQHCGEMHRYLVEFDFRSNNRVALGCDDGRRALRALAGAQGRRLTYRRPDEAALTA